jgi:EamA domain-containing membrane protein RarD
VVNPAFSVALGLTLFQERIHREPLESTLAVLSLLVMFVGVVALTLSSGAAGPARGPEPASH